MAKDPEGTGLARTVKLLTDYRALAAEGAVVLGWFPYTRDILVNEFGYLYSEAESFIYALIQALDKIGA